MLEPGGTFGDFDVIRELGRGGMGAVYLVRNPADGGEYAAKVMFQGLPERDEVFKRRFIREAEIAMAADHPNLVKVYEVGRDPDTGLAYMIMDYVGGGSLHDRIVRRLVEKRGPYSVGEALAVVRPLLSALSEAEKKGIVHRDIKPDNILFDEEDVPKLADLGIAKISDQDSTTLLTMNNVIIGTPAYMAPEQLLDSHHVDARADLYSLGIVLWEMLVGECPNAGADTADLMARAFKGVRIPDIRMRRRQMPLRIVEFLRRMTDPKPEKRFSSAESALRFLDDWQLRRKKAYRRIMTGLVTVFALLLGSVLYVGIRWIRQSEAVEAEVRGEFAVPESVD